MKEPESISRDVWDEVARLRVENDRLCGDLDSAVNKANHLLAENKELSGQFKDQFADANRLRVRISATLNRAERAEAKLRRIGELHEALVQAVTIAQAEKFLTELFAEAPPIKAI